MDNSTPEDITFINAGTRHSWEIPLYKATQKEYVNVVNALLAHGADVNKAARNGATPLLVAVDQAVTTEDVELRSKFYSIMDALIRHGANYQLAIQLANTYGRQDVVTLINVRRFVLGLIDAHNSNFTKDEVQGKSCIICFDSFSAKFPELFGPNEPTPEALKARIFKFDGCYCNESFLCRNCAIEYANSASQAQSYVHYNCPLCHTETH